jgi:anti-sigma B factor antagonist
MSEPAMPFDITAYGPNLYFLEGELDLATVPVLMDALDDALSRGGLIMLDVSALSFIDGRGVGALRALTHRLRSGCIVVHGVGPMLRRVAEIVELGTEPRLHLVGCGEDPYPRGLAARWAPSADLVEKFAELRQAHLALRDRTLALRESARDARSAARMIRSVSATVRAA